MISHPQDWQKASNLILQKNNTTRNQLLTRFGWVSRIAWFTRHDLTRFDFELELSKKK